MISQYIVTWRFICKSSNNMFLNVHGIHHQSRPRKCTFTIFFRLSLRFIISKEGNLLDLKKIQVIVNRHVPLNSL